MIDIGPQRKMDRRMLMAQQLMQGGQTSGTGHWSDGLARGVNQMLGAYLTKQYGREQEQKDAADKAQNQAFLSSALRQMSGTPGGTQQFSDGTAIDWQAQQPDMMAAGQTLAANPDTADMGTEVLFKALARKQGIADRDEERAYEGRIRGEDRAARQAEMEAQREFQREMVNARGPASAPANVQEWQYFNSLSPEDQQRFLGMKRAAQTLNLGNEQVVLDPLTGQPRTSMQMGAAPEVRIDPENNRIISTQGAAPGQNPSATIGSIPRSPEQLRDREDMRASFERQLRTGYDLLNSPARVAGTGMSSMMSIIPGTDARDFAANLDAFKSQSFLPMVQQLRGLGALSNAEGEKLTAAIGAIDPGMSEDAFKQSLSTILGDLGAAYERHFQRDFAYQPGGVAGAMGRSPQPEQSGLTPEEEAELQQLRRQLGGVR